jgi:hypothetical protein
MTTASSLALETLANALLATAARLEAEQQAREFEQGLLEMRTEYSFAEPINQPAMAAAGN